MGTIRRAAPVIVIAILAVWFYATLQETGHGWGDDFALYVNQARALIRGDVARVVSDSAFGIANSGAHGFSPITYPWGFPILLAPVILATGGIDWEALKMVTVVSMVAALVAYYVLVRRRMSPWVASALTLVVAVAAPYVYWVGTVTSDLPSLAVVLGTLVWIDRCRRRGLLGGCRRSALIGLGLAAGFAFNVRRENIALLVALGAATVVELWPYRRRRRAELRRLLRVAAVPYTAFAVFVVGLQIALPSSLTLDGPDGGLGEIAGNVSWYRAAVAESLSLKQIGDSPISAFGSHGVGMTALVGFAVLAVLGMIASLLRHRGRDVHVIVYVVVAALLICVQPFHESRYIFAVFPWMLFFAAEAVVSIHRQAGQVVAGAVAALIVWPSLGDLMDAYSYHREYDYVINGPTTDSSKALFDAVLRCTPGQDVVLFGQSRTMNLLTERRSIQAGNMELALGRADWLALSNDDVNYWEPAITPTNAAEHGVTRVWHNDEWSLYRVGPPGRQRPLCADEAG